MDGFILKTCFLIIALVMFAQAAQAVVFEKDPVAKFDPTGTRIQFFEKRLHRSATGPATLNYYLLRPLDYDPSKSYPLVVSLHSASGHNYGAFVLSDTGMRRGYPAFVLVPHVQSGGWSWPIFPNDKKTSPMEHVMSVIIDLADEFPIDKTRIYLTGYSTGGYGTFIMASRYPGFFAAAAPLCGSGESKYADLMAKTPFWVFHGADDPYTPAAESRRTVTAIRNAGGKALYTEYPGVGHNVWDYAYSEAQFWAWLFAQKRR